MLQTKFQGRIFEIVEDNPDVGFYLYVYENGRCIRDYLQNDEATCIDIAQEEFNVPKEYWKHNIGDSH